MDHSDYWRSTGPLYPTIGSDDVRISRPIRWRRVIVDSIVAVAISAIALLAAEFLKYEFPVISAIFIFVPFVVGIIWIIRRLPRNHHHSSIARSTSSAPNFHANVVVMDDFSGGQGSSRLWGVASERTPFSGRGPVSSVTRSKTTRNWSPFGSSHVPSSNPLFGVASSRPSAPSAPSFNYPTHTRSGTALFPVKKSE